MKLYKVLSALFLALAVVAVAAKPPKTGIAAMAVTPKAAGVHYKYSAAQAQAIALKKCPGKLAGKTAISKVKGKSEYVVCVKTKKGMMRVDVNPNTGKVDMVEKATMGKRTKVEPGPKTTNKGA